MTSAPRKIVAIFWDTQNCPVPQGISASNVANAFRQLALQHGTIKTFHALVPNTSASLISSQEGKDNAAHQLELKQAGVSLLETESKFKNSAQISIVNELWDFAYEAKDQIRQGLAHIILIAKAADYAPAIGRLRNKGVEVTLVHNGSATNPENDEEDGNPKDTGDGGILRINSSDFIDFQSLMKEFAGNSSTTTSGSGGSSAPPNVNSGTDRIVKTRGRAMTTPSAMWVNNGRNVADPIPSTTSVPNGIPFLASPRLRSGSYSGSPVGMGVERGSLEDFLSFSSPSSPLLHSSPTSSSPPSPSLSSSPTHTSPPSTPTPLDSLPDPLRTELNSLNAVLSSLRADGFKPTFKVIMPRLGSLLGSRIDRARFERMLKAAQQHLGVQVDFTLKTCYPAPPNGGMYGGFDPSRASRAQFDAPILEAFARFLGEHIGRTFPNRFDMAQWVQAFGPEPVRNLKQGPVVTLCQLAINEKLVAPLLPDSGNNSGSSNNATSGTSSPGHHAYASSALHGNTGLVIVEPPGLAFGFVQVNTVRARSNTTGSGMPATNTYGWVGRKDRDLSDSDIASLGHSRSFGQLPSTQSQSPSQTQFRFGGHGQPSSPQSQSAHYPFNQPSYSLYQRQSGVSSLNEDEISSPFSNGDSSRSIAGLWHTPHSLQQDLSPTLSPSPYPQSGFNEFDSSDSQYLSPNIHNLTPHTSHNLSHTFTNTNQNQTSSNTSSSTWGSTLHSPQPFRLPSPSSYYNSQQTSSHFAPSPPSPSSSPSPQQNNPSPSPTHAPPNKTLSSPSILSTAASTLINSSSPLANSSSPLATSHTSHTSHQRSSSNQYNVNNIGVWASTSKSRRASASALTIPHPNNPITPLSQSNTNSEGY